MQFDDKQLTKHFFAPFSPQLCYTYFANVFPNLFSFYTVFISHCQLFRICWYHCSLCFRLFVINYIHSTIVLFFSYVMWTPNLLFATDEKTNKHSLNSNLFDEYIRTSNVYMWVFGESIQSGTLEYFGGGQCLLLRFVYLRFDSIFFFVVCYNAPLKSLLLLFCVPSNCCTGPLNYGFMSYCQSKRRSFRLLCCLLCSSLSVCMCVRIVCVCVTHRWICFECLQFNVNGCVHFETVKRNGFEWWISIRWICRRFGLFFSIFVLTLEKKEKKSFSLVFYGNTKRVKA